MSTTRQGATGVIFHREGDTIILTDPMGREYACTTPQELWDDMCSILADQAIPKMLVSAPDEEGKTHVEADLPTEKEFFDTLSENAGAVAQEFWGPFFGKVVRAGARRGGPRALRFLRKISRNSKKGEPVGRT